MLKFDIILPLFNPTKFVYDTIDSVLAQEYTYWHLWIVDDKSRKNILSELEIKYNSFLNKISFIQLNENGGAAKARMIAIEQGKNELIAFIDQDDTWFPEKLRLQSEEFNKNPAISCVHTNIQITDENGRLLQSETNLDNKWRNDIDWNNLEGRQLTRTLYIANRIRFVSAVVRRASLLSIDGFNTNLFGGEDEDFWIRFSNKFRIGYLNKKLVTRKKHANNTSEVCLPERILGELKVAEERAQDFNYLEDLYPIKEKQLLLSGVRSSLYRKKYKLVRKFFRMIIKKYPTDFYLLLKSVRYIFAYLIKRLLGLI